ncbi:hypothetical protein ACKRAQ_02335 [Helicobacter pylori]
MGKFTKNNFLNTFNKIKEFFRHEWKKEQRAITKKLKADYNVSDSFISCLNELIRKKGEQGYKIITDFKACEWSMSIAFLKAGAALIRNEIF